jgi:hypothetical protein
MNTPLYAFRNLEIVMHPAYLWRSMSTISGSRLLTQSWKLSPPGILRDDSVRLHQNLHTLG